MSAKVGSWVARGIVTIGVATAGYMVYRTGGAAEARSPLPGAVAPAPSAIASAATASPVKSSQGVEVKLFLTELLADARIDAPTLKASQPFLATHWRKLQGPWVRPGGSATGMVYHLALRTSQSELQYMVGEGSGKAWVPDARTWNMNEGSFDQREVLFTPTPCEVTFKIKVPENARFQFSPAVIQHIQATTIFSVAVVPSQGEGAGKEQVVATHRVQSADAKKWFEASADLGAFAGQDVELRLRTALDKPQPTEKPYVPPPPPPPPQDGEEPAKPKYVEPIPTMGMAVWGNPAIVSNGPTRVPYNVLWVVVDALRPDVVASLHDDADDQAKASAKIPPLEAQLPKIPGLTPNIDAIGEKGVRFTKAYSGGSWTRPGTLSMLSGTRSTELGIDSIHWIVPPDQLVRYYTSDPPLLPLLLRRSGVATRAFVNNFFMLGYAAVGVDMGFDRVDDHRYRTRDTLEVTNATVSWLKANKDSRFFVFANYNSPHDPYDPPEQFKKLVPPPPVGPKDPTTRLYMAEAAKDDEAIGVLVQTLEELKIRERTLIVVTADHGETLSAAHAGTSSLDRMPVRYHHAVSNFEETTKVPLVMHLPGVLEGGKVVKDRVRNIDMAPTLLEIMGLAKDPRMIGRSLMPLVKGEKEEPRYVLSEGRGTRGFMWGKYRLLTRESGAQFTAGYGKGGALFEELFDLDEDPGERNNLAKDKLDELADMKARLAAALKNVPVAGASPTKDGDKARADAKAERPTLHLRFAGAGKARRIAGTIRIGDPKKPVPQITIDPIGIAKEAFKIVAERNVEIALVTSIDEVVGLDLKIDPPATEVTWELFMDDKPWPEKTVFAGPFGLLAVAAKAGLTSDEARAEIYSPFLPEIDVARDLGLFVTRDRRGEATEVVLGADGEGAKEMNKVLQDWGYAHGSSGK